MKTLVLYYSYEGTTATIAKAIAEQLGADCERLSVVNEPKKNGLGKFVWGGSQVLMKRLPRIEPLKYKPESYDLLVIGTPVWAGSYVPAIRTLFHTFRFSGKKTAFFYTDLGGPGHIAEHMEKALSKGTVIGSLHLAKASQNIDKAVAAAKSWSSTLK
ncbi:MAG: NAD(P)H-dependent oxidoreductase [Treponema sp.]|jgi:flavodoxin|nr:NAD(P)H-dependent oxidoreductase [Treponema sp.]